MPGKWEMHLKKSLNNSDCSLKFLITNSEGGIIFFKADYSIYKSIDNHKIGAGDKFEFHKVSYI